MPDVGKFQGQDVEPQKLGGQRLGMGVPDGVMPPGNNRVTQLDLGMERDLCKEHPVGLALTLTFF